MRIRFVRGGAVFGTAIVLASCSGTIPVQYQTQSFMKLDAGEASMGEFGYAPAQTGTVQPNQLQNTAVGSIYIGEDVAKYVQRATALELQNAGILIDPEAPVELSGTVETFEIDDLGYSVDWTYVITYAVADSMTGERLFERTYTPDERTTGKFGMPSDYTASINLIILDAVEAFLADAKREQLFAR